MLFMIAAEDDSQALPHGIGGNNVVILAKTPGKITVNTLGKDETIDQLTDRIVGATESITLQLSSEAVVTLMDVLADPTLNFTRADVIAKLKAKMLFG